MREKYIEGIGSVKFKKNNRARNISIAVKPLNGVHVTVPNYVSYLDAEKIVSQKREWIVNHLDKAREIEKGYTKFSEDKTYRTKFHELVLNRNNGDKITVRVQNGKINVSYPLQLNSDSAIVQSAIRNGIVRALKVEAKNYLPARVKELAEKSGMNFQNVAVKNVKSRWGSCSRKKNINLNIHLMRLPEYLIDYVILHELAHTIELNHSKKFWALLDSLTGGAKQLDKELNNYRVAIF
jgi:hypothetical protein